MVVRIDGIEQVPLTRLLDAADAIVSQALEEDLAQGDPASEALLEASESIHAVIRAKAPGVVAGLPVAEKVLAAIDSSIRFFSVAQDGQEVLPGEVLAEIIGPTASVLSGERTALNFLQRLSGIATMTREYCDLIAMTDTILLDTRKTAPGLRALDKYAVRIGGGANHRIDLGTLGMIKDNHIAASGGIANAYKRFRARSPELPVEIEVKSFEQIDETLALSPRPERILLDEFRSRDVARAVQRIAGRIATEASGSVSDQTIQALALTGVDSISVGRLTHSVRALDISMDAVDQDPQERIETMRREIVDWKAHLGSSVKIFGHHYIRDDVLEFADVLGDSLQLSQLIATTDAEYIIFCGVHFMGETAALLAKPHQRIYLPDRKAGCYLAECASLPAVRAAWNQLCTTIKSETSIVPIAYVNSSSDVKAFVGEKRGLICTSANSERALAWALERGRYAFFLPDRNLAINTAHKLGIPDSEILTWNTDRRLERSSLQRVRVIVWPGSCNVHQRFRAWHVDAIRTNGNATIAVHPECKPSVAAVADRVGSTSSIINWVAESEPGTHWAIGTEHRLINRLAAQHPDKRIVSLSDVPSFCRTMSQVTLESLHHLIERLISSQATPMKPIADARAQHARMAIERMLKL